MIRHVALAVQLRCVAAAVGLGILAGCATAPQQAVRSPLERPGAPRAVAVIPVRVSVPQPEGRIGAPVQGAPEITSVGAIGIGVSAAVLAVMVLVNPLGVAVPLVSVPFHAANVMAGALSGLAAVLPEDKALLVDGLNPEAFAELRLPEGFAKAVAAGVATFTPYRVAVLDEAAPKSLSSGPFLPEAQGRAFGAVIEARVTKAGFAATLGQDAKAMYVAAEARLIDTATGTTVARRGVFYLSSPHPVAVWARDDFALVGLERAKAQQTLAERIVDDFLLQAEVAPIGTARPQVPRECGIVPLRPRPEWSLRLFPDSVNSASGFPESYPLAVPVESRTPSLAWNFEPSPAHLKPPLPWTGAADRRYDLRIWNEIDGAPGALVYERLGLVAAEHRVETELNSDATYYWSVRMRYSVAGRPRATRWSASNEPGAPRVPAFRTELYTAHGDGDDAMTARCQPLDLVPCACLDYIPGRNHYAFRTP